MGQRTFVRKGAHVNRRDVLITLSTTALAGCTTTSGKRGDPTAKRREIDTGVTRALDELQRYASGAPLIDEITSDDLQLSA